MNVYLNVVQIIVSITLIVIILLQVKGDAGAGVFGGGTGVARTRRGLERTLFNVTIIIAAIFLLVSFLSAFLGVRA